MIVVKVELWSAQSGHIKDLGTCVIDNVDDRGKKANYRVRVARKLDAGNVMAALKNPLREGVVYDYPKLSYNMWRLVIRSLRVAFPEEK